MNTDVNLSFNSSTDTLICQNITSNNNITTSFINSQYPATITEQFENGICVATGNQNSMYNYTGFSYFEANQQLNVSNISVNNINGAPYNPPESIIGLMKFFYYEKTNLTNQTAETLSYNTASSLTLDITKFYLVKLTLYSFILKSNRFLV